MESRFTVRLGSSSVALTRDDLIVGRDVECGIRLDDERASRRHAVLRVRDDAPEIEDLGSRNGVWVDGMRIHGCVKVAHGAVIAIGDARLVVIDAASRQGQARTAQALVAAGADRRRTVAPNASTFAGPSLGSLTLGAGAALRGGDADEMRSAAMMLFEHLAREDARAEPALVDALDVSTQAALALAESQREPSWTDRLFEINAKYSRVLDRDTIHRIHELALAGVRGNADACASYIAKLRSRRTPLDESELHELRRLEAVRHTLATR